MDVGNDSVVTPGYRVSDEYVWLAGRPVAVVRDRLDATTWARTSDGISPCARSGEAAACGPYFIVTDALVGKPVAVLDSAGKVASLMRYGPFGTVNRREVRQMESAHPYASPTSTVLGNLTLTPLAGMDMKLRFRFDGIDTEGTATAPTDYAQLRMSGAAVGPRIGGAHAGRRWSEWVDAGTAVYLDFKADGRNCQPDGGVCPSDGGVPTGGNWPYRGVSVTQAEVRLSQVGAKGFRIPLRFPGQYFDEETEALENWNRYYEPSTGRYLSPEPMLQQPSWVKHEAEAGFTTPTYAYARNNPVRYSDATGLWPSAFTPGKLCNEGCDTKSGAPGCEFMSKPEENNAAPLEGLPPAGQCVDADAVYTRWGVVKIPNNCICTVKCAGANQVISCGCAPGYGSAGSPTWFPRTANLPQGWQPNTLPAPPTPVAPNLYMSLWGSGMQSAYSGQ